MTHNVSGRTLSTVPLAVPPDNTTSKPPLTVVLTVAVVIYSRSQDVKPSDEMRARRLQQAA